MRIIEKRYIKNSIYFKVCFAGILFLVGLACATLFSTRIPYSLLSESYDAKHLKPTPQKVLYKGNRVEGEFTAHYDNLGILAVRFRTFHRINTDFLRFQIKKKGDKNWYYSALYKVDQFQDNQLFPFGFPIIQNAKGKDFIFEIISEQGKKNNAVIIQDKVPMVFVAKYQYPKSEIKPGGDKFVWYGIHKVLNTLRELSLSNVDILYFSPFLWYLFLLFLNAQSIFKIRAPILPNFLVFIILFISTLGYISGNIDFVTVTVVTAFGCWFIMIGYYRFSGTVSLYAFLLFLFFSSLFSLFKQPDAVAETSYIAYAFLIIGLVQEILSIVPYLKGNKK